MAEICLVTPLHWKKIQITAPQTLYGIQIRSHHETIQYQTDRNWHELKNPVILEDTVLFPAKQEPKSGYLELLENRFAFGRHCLKEADRNISSLHFTIARQAGIWICQDENSTNGTYINGKRITRHPLRFGDHIQCASHTLIFLETGLWTDFETAPSQIQYPPIARPDNPKPAPPRIPPEHEPTLLELELWQPAQNVPRQSWTAAIGSSLMMSTGTLLSAALLVATGTGTMETIRTTLTMSLSMAASHLLFSLLQRKSTTRQQRNMEDQRKEAWNLYIANMEEKITAIQRNIQQEQSETAEKWQHLDDSLFQTDSPIPFRWTSQPLIQLGIPHLTYVQRQQPEYRQLEKLLQQAATPICTLEYLPDQGQICAHTESIFHAIVWTQNPRHIKWNGPPQHKHPFPHQYHEHKTDLTGWKGKTIGKKGSTIEIIHDRNALKMSRNDLHKAAGIAHKERETRPDSPWKVKLGTTSDGTEIFLDLIEDGPHGLAAGTTGSGKSELLTLLLARLIAQNSPETFQFLLLDFKGGAFAAPFAGDPHCTGICTNLQPQDVSRLQTALHAEMEKRQQKMAAFVHEHPALSADIDTYNKYMETPMARLVILTDECAQMKEACPELMDYLQNTARIGRSLGIHLILATQKPAGIISSQILANTSFILCGKVQTAMESHEILMTSQAAQLKGPGQMILQSDRTQIQFQADYARRKIPRDGQITSKDELSANITWLDATLEASRNAHPPAKAILLSPLDQIRTDAPITIDDPAHARQIPIHFQPEMKICIQTDQSEPIVSWLMKTRPDTIHIKDVPEGKRWFLAAMDQPLCILLEEEEQMALFENSHHTIFLLQKAAPARQIDLHLLCGTASWTWIQTGKTSHKTTWPWAMERNEENDRQARFNVEKQEVQPTPPTALLARLPDLNAPESWQDIFCVPVLGHENGIPCLWDGSQIEYDGTLAKEIADRLTAMFEQAEARPLQQPGASRRLLISEWKDKVWKLGIQVPPGIHSPLLYINGQEVKGLHPLLYA